MIMASCPITSWQIDGETMEKWQTIFLNSKLTVDGDYSHEIKTLAPWKKNYDQAKQHIKKAETLLCQQGLSIQSFGFSSSHVWM